MDSADLIGVGWSTRRLRLLGLASFAVCIGVLALPLFGPGRKSAAMPGPLSGNHASLADRCEACHALSADAIASPFHGLRATDLGFDQSERCAACHDLGDHPLTAHGWGSEELEAHSRASEAPYAAFVPSDAEGRLACAACHGEHRGWRTDPQQLNDGRCQVCHAEPFEDFENGHPELTGYGYDRRTRIVFDHTTHLYRHFPGDEEAVAPTTCTDCHETGPNGRTMRVRSYEQSCAACHDDEILGETNVGGNGVAVFSLPALDTLTLEERGVGIGTWPADSAVVETEFTPFVTMLLAVDERLEPDLETLSELDLLDLMDASDRELESVARVAWAVKALFDELDGGGHDSLARRMERAVGRPLDRREKAGLLAKLPQDLVRNALAAWLPGLGRELRAHRAGEFVATTSELSEGANLDRDSARQAWVDAGGWYLQDMEFEIKYRPADHADPFQRSWLDLSAASARGAELFEALARPDAVGACTKCHSIDETGARAVVNWAAKSEPGAGLTRFSHVHHFASPSDNACLSCHSLSGSEGVYLESFEHRDPRSFSSNFEPITLETCTDCHGRNRSSSDCTTCHSYHSSPSSRMLPRARLDALPAPSRD